MNTILIKDRYVWIVLMGLILFQSCTKNELVPYEREPLNKILEYTVVNNPQHMMGAIDHDNHTIQVYLPYYTNLDYLIANIKLDEGATLLRQDSTVINLLEDELDPVTVGDTVQYIVRSAEGQYRTYTLTQVVLPHDEALSILGYGNSENMGGYNFVLHTMEDGIYSVNANRAIYLFGNFYSSSSLGKFTLTNRATGEVHDDYVNISSVFPQADNRYVMTARISPEAAYGTYDVKMEHQGRTTELPPVQIYYSLFYGEYYSSSTAFAQADTIVFTASEATYAKPKRLFARINKTANGVVPTGFPEDLYGKDIEMEILSHSRTEIKAIFPDLPVGLYSGAGTVNLLAIFEEEDGYAENTPFNSEVAVASPSGLGFAVLPKQE